MPQERVDFLSDIHPLESLSIFIAAPYTYAEGDIHRTQFPLTEIIETHCPTLRSLLLHQGESHDPALRRPMLSLDDLASIRTACPNLNYLGLDIDRNDLAGWPVSTLVTIMQWPNLTSLELGLEIGADLRTLREAGDYGWNPQGLDGPGPFREPRMSLNTSETMFMDLRRVKQGHQLERVEFVVGDYTELSYSGPIYLPSWEEGRARKFVCQTGETTGESERHCDIIGDGDPYGDDFSTWNDL